MSRLQTQTDGQEEMEEEEEARVLRVELRVGPPQPQTIVDAADILGCIREKQVQMENVNQAFLFMKIFLVTFGSLLGCDLIGILKLKSEPETVFRLARRLVR